MRYILYSILILALQFSLDARSQNSVLDPLLTDEKSKIRQPASVWPVDLGSEFVVAEPEGRAPASTRKNQNQKKKPVPAANRSRLPEKITDGFELRVRYNQLISTFWVTKQGERYDLLFANSAGTRSSLSLQEAQFQKMHSELNRLKFREKDLRKCQNQSFQLYFRASGKPERAMSACVNEKSQTAQYLMSITQSLSSLVR